MPSYVSKVRKDYRARVRSCLGTLQKRNAFMFNLHGGTTGSPVVFAPLGIVGGALVAQSDSIVMGLGFLVLTGAAFILASAMLIRFFINVRRYRRLNYLSL